MHLFKFGKVSPPAPEHDSQASGDSTQEIRQLFHRFSFGTVSIKTSSSQSLETLLDLAREELCAGQRRAA